MDEQEFIRRTQACSQKLYWISRAILPNWADCDDAIQEAMLRAWRKRNTLREEAYFETWLVRIVINECKSALHRGRRNATTELTEAVPAPEEPAPDPVLRDALYRLDEKLRLPLVLHYLEGYKVEEIARLTGTPVGTVKHRLRRAKDQLKEELEKGGYVR
ncbi:MAG: RNA polymerase sigma factor [Clostridia bacterium]|nr:RNA polymerase sigma factor [Clostridia bacterium]